MILTTINNLKTLNKKYYKICQCNKLSYYCSMTKQLKCIASSTVCTTLFQQAIECLIYTVNNLLGV